MYIRSGSDINLTCVVLETPDPPSFIYWYRDRDVINYSGRGGISVVTEKQTRTSRLLISKAQPPDTGNYTCAPSASDSASVTVHVLNGKSARSDRRKIVVYSRTVFGVSPLSPNPRASR